MSHIICYCSNINIVPGRHFVGLKINKVNGINHWLLFDKLLKREMPCYIVRILVYWYKTQTMNVQWASCESSSFIVTNGVRQGGILSSKLLIVYMD